MKQALGDDLGGLFLCTLRTQLFHPHMGTIRAPYSAPAQALLVQPVPTWEPTPPHIATIPI